MEFLIDNNKVKMPKELSVNIQTLDSGSSGRNANGTMVRDIIAKKTKLDVKWGPLSTSEVSLILRLIDRSSFSIRYFDPQEGGMITKKFYCGDRSTPVYSWNDIFSAMMWQGLSVPFIEM
ncbi:hypothetical protein IHP33_12180 [Enterococcus faecalis]|uniref:DUF6711 family protein n=1 Tax=Enterococcus faecalis TaxID=1351 RepID=UPI001783B4AB|nr:DUF6711 family protein [Enterococcus faecalis]MBD9846478.1 hypothetical protein [Enterococcus faecalis]